MSIPMTCSGCKSSFDVPDNLAGKTIRCTSCKAQMSVPMGVDEDEPAAPPAKKPFGAGAKSSPETPAAKTAAKPPAPAVKAAKAAVADDEDDDDDKAAKGKPGKPPAKKLSGITGAARKRRDDDDDDDDDDRPSKKKAGGPPMVAIIAGVTLAVAVLAGVGIYFLTGSDEQKPETAANTSNTSGQSGGGRAAPTPTPDGAPGPNPAVGPNRGGGTGGLTPAGDAGGPRPGPAGGRPNLLGGFDTTSRLGTPGPWAAFNGDGFSADMPGTPEIKNQTVEGGGMNLPLKVSGVGNATATTAVVVAVTFPPEAVQELNGDPSAMLAAYMIGLNQNPDIRNASVADTTVDGHPAKDIRPQASAREGRMRVVAVKDRIYMFVASASKTPSGKAEVDRFFNSVKITYKGDLVASNTPMGSMPPPFGMPPRGTPPAGVPAVGDNPPVGMPPFGMPPRGMPPVGQPPAVGMPPFGMPSVGQPPVGQPPVGQPPVGQPPVGQPPTGGSSPHTGIGNLKTKIESFYAAAFDADKKEFYTVEFRADGRTVKGMLHRYSYPDFKQLGRYKLPQLATRAAVDSANGKLYLATVSNTAFASPQLAQQWLQQNLLENASASGDIAVYDLKPLQDGKGPDGKPLDESVDLKPLATVSMKQVINGLELSADGKQLYALVTTGTTKKSSSLAVIDTETRKETQRKGLTNAARDLVKGPDGKLVIVEDFNAGSKSSGVVTFDPVTMSTSNPNSFSGGVLDVAVVKDGSLLVTVLPVNNPPPGGGGGGPGAMPPGLGGGPGLPGGGSSQNQTNFQFYLIDAKGKTEIDLGAAGRSSNGGYVKYDADGKRLYVSSFRGAGLDAFDVTDLAAATGAKLKASITKAKAEGLGGHFFLSPDGKALVFHVGVVIETDNIGGGDPAAGGAGAPGFPGGQPGFPGGVPPIGQPPGGIPPVGMPPAIGQPPGGPGAPPVGIPPVGMPGEGPGRGGPGEGPPGRGGPGAMPPGRGGPGEVPGRGGPGEVPGRGAPGGMPPGPLTPANPGGEGPGRGT